MSRRNPSGFTGANAIPLGTRNKAIGAKRSFTSSPPKEEPVKPNESSIQASQAFKAAQAAAASLSKLAHLEPSSNTNDVWTPPPPKKNYESNDLKPQPPPPAKEEDRGRKRKKKSRWGSMIRTEIPGMPATIPTHLTPEQQKAYIFQLQIEDITRKLKSGDLGIPINPEDRSPSPEPIYNGEGKRMNTREYRTRKRLEEERHNLIQKMIDLNSEYKPPMDYKPTLQRISERVAIPQDINPNINFVGLLIGPRGNTLKKIEKESNCKIMIRGKGSVKEGKIGRKDGQPLPGEDEPLHALVSSTCPENVKKAVDQINEIIKQGIEQPEEENDLRKLQLMELAKLNGTLREDLMPKERAWLKPENQNITNTTICTKCGGRGHLAQDCVAQQPSMSLQPGVDGAPPVGPGGVDRAKMDSEYMSLMAELGEGPPSGDGGNNSGPRFNSGPPNRFGGPRQPFMGSGRGRFGGPGNHRPRFGPRGGNDGNRPPMNQGGPPPPWMGGPGPYGPPSSGGPNQWGPQGGGMAPPFSGAGGFPNAPPPNDGSMPPWMSNPDGSNMMGMGGSGGSVGGNGSMYGGNDTNSSGNYYNQPPPPPPSNAPQPPPPPSSGSGMGAMSQWQQSWGGDKKDGDGNAGDSNIATSGTNSYADSYGGYGTMSHAGMGMDPSMGGAYGMGAYGNMAMWGMGSGAVPPPPGPVPPPMPSGPGPVPPPPPGSHGSGDGSQGGMNDGYNSMGMGMMQGYGMPPAPPPPPPQ